MVLFPSFSRSTNGGETYRGTADAVYKNLALIERHSPSMVAVFAADQVYRMDVRQMVMFHRECDADATVAATRVPLANASSFGIIAAGARGEICDFQEKPEWPDAIPACPEQAYASMGSYLFNTDVLVESLERALREGATDFGKNILPSLIRSRHVYAYDFAGNRVPGIGSHEEQAYWRDEGTLEAYASAYQDVVGTAPRFNLHNLYWPLLPSRFSLPCMSAVSNSSCANGKPRSPGSQPYWNLGAFSAEREHPQFGKSWQMGNA